MPVDFTSEYPSCCALLALFDVFAGAVMAFAGENKRALDLAGEVAKRRPDDKSCSNNDNGATGVSPYGPRSLADLAWGASHSV